MSTFKSFDLYPMLYQYLDEAGITKPTEVQRKSIPELLTKKNLSVLAQTGTGKTLSYALPIFHTLKSNDDDIPMEEQVGSPRAVILSPTRELNQQTFKVFKSLAHHGKLRIRQLVGGDKGGHSRRLAESAYDILIASPARLKSALQRGEVDAKLIEYLVLDEADQLLDMGFTKDLKAVLATIDKKSKLNPCISLFSATWPAQYEEFVTHVFEGTEFKEVKCQGGVQLKKNIETFNIYLGMKEKRKMLQTFVDKQSKGSGIVFTNRKEDVASVYEFLKGEFPRKRLYCLHGNMSSTERKKTFEAFRTRGGLLVSSDISARGLDVDGLKWVLNYDLPFEAVYYIHRCGRVGRGKGKGEVYNFVTTADNKLMGRINEAILSQSSLALKPLGENKRNVSKAKKTAKTTAKSGSVRLSKKKMTKKSAVRKKTPRYKKKKR